MILLIKILPLLVEDDRHKVVITQRIKDCLVLLKTASKNDVEAQTTEIIKANPQELETLIEQKFENFIRFSESVKQTVNRFKGQDYKK